MSKAVFTILAIILVLAIAGGAFLRRHGVRQVTGAGKLSQPGRSFVQAADRRGGAPSGGQPGQGSFAGRGQRANGQGGGFVFGTIKEIGDGASV